MSEDVSKFLAQVKELGDRRIEEDEARSRELEEKILQERRERQARRAERARSISPQKSSPANTPPPQSHSVAVQGSERLNLESSPILEPPGTSELRSPPQNEHMATRRPLSLSPSKENESPNDTEHKPSSPSTPTRTGSTARGLSWQARPNSQTSERSRSRPLSMVATENAARSSNTPSEPVSASDTLSRDQIASSLSSKDPAWFRQTADRGANSAAYRRSQVEDAQTAEVYTMRTQLPGMSRTPSGDHDGRPDSPALHNNLISPFNLEHLNRDSQPEDGTREDKPGLMSPPPLGRISPSKTERPVSPTKGTGGFVQSAMMKRSDSVNKRWSVQPPAGLQRADSVASNRSNRDLPSRPSAGSRSRPVSFIQQASSDSVSLLGSMQVQEDTKSPGHESKDLEETTPPTSPSKIMDPRRWSPTKASWLESALNKPESPKPKPTPPPSNQPAWMAELQKAKAQKAAHPDAERSRSPTISHKHQVSIGGLMRSNAPSTTVKLPSVGGVHSPSPSIGSTTSRPAYGSFRKDSQSSATTEIENGGSGLVGDYRVIESSPPVSRPKPETPPKKDFRANLKPRSVTSASSSSQPDELKNVFGKLRKTTTQNYVAPDELKNNILRGKAGLAITGGPKRTERKDEFKDAILAKKKEFQQVQTEGRGVTRSNSTTSEKPVPEGLARRAELGRSNTIKRDSETSHTKDLDSKRSSAVSQHDSIHEPTLPKPDRFGSIEKTTSAPEPGADKIDRSNISIKSAQELPLSMKHKDSPLTPTASRDASAPARLPGKIGGGALANRFNPVLAGFIARGPPSVVPGASGSGRMGDALVSDSQSYSVTGANNNEAGSTPKLTHMTKNRARGPKRKAPTAAAASAPASIPPQSELETADTKQPGTSPAISSRIESPVKETAPQVKPLVDSSKRGYDEAPRSQAQPITLVGSSNSPFKSVPLDPIGPSPKIGNRIHEQVASRATQRRQPSPTKPDSPTKQVDEPHESVSQPPSPRKLDLKRVSRFLDDTPRSPANALDSEKVGNEPKSPIQLPTPKTKLSLDEASRLEFQKPQPLSPPPTGSSRPLPDPKLFSTNPQPSSHKDPSDISPQPKDSASSGGRALPSIPPVARVEPLRLPVRQLPREPESSPRPLPSPGLKSPPRTTSPMRSPTKLSNEVLTLLSDFFGPERSPRSYHVDAAELLMRRPNATPPNIRTLNVQLFQFAADGKKQRVPAHRERTLFEREMYLCYHAFNNEAGKKTTEVYFWAGDEVPHSVVEDVSIFLSREARAMGGKLIKMQQGKETPEFLQALGGIVVTQRGSTNKYDSLAPHMLCGRRYHGHVVFDEVDFTPAALSSGFSYLITQAGRCFLWKGKGCGIDELSCARLIGMDYALSGEMEEIEDGRESAAFWDLFDGGSKAGSADHWKLKPNYDKYCSRLFFSDTASKQQIIEISPFSQADLQPTGVYVIDAFFELYIVVGSRTQSQFASFHNALDFAQEYGILAAGMEDRPFVPFSTVVLEGIPRDMKSVFRKWRDSHSPTITNVNANTSANANTGLKRGRSLKVVSLNQALSALSE